MKKGSWLLVFFLALPASSTYAGFLDTFVDVFKGTDKALKGELDENTVISGLKQALSVGTKNAVKTVSKNDGYFSNPNIKIQMPAQIQDVTNILGKFGFQKQVDDFILTMNRSAEKAAPKALNLFGEAIKEMTVEDAMKLLHGGDTSVTEYFKSKTSEKIFETFKPIIASNMDQVGVNKAYHDMISKYESIPFIGMFKESLDINNYVTKKAVDGLFHMVGEEEKKIRTDPAARVTDLLKAVFGKLDK